MITFGKTGEDWIQEAAIERPSGVPEVVGVGETRAFGTELAFESGRILIADWSNTFLFERTVAGEWIEKFRYHFPEDSNERTELSIGRDTAVILRQPYLLSQYPNTQLSHIVVAKRDSLGNWNQELSSPMPIRTAPPLITDLSCENDPLLQSSSYSTSQRSDIAASDDVFVFVGLRTDSYECTFQDGISTRTERQQLWIQPYYRSASGAWNPGTPISEAMWNPQSPSSELSVALEGDILAVSGGPNDNNVSIFRRIGTFQWIEEAAFSVPNLPPNTVTSDAYVREGQVYILIFNQPLYWQSEFFVYEPDVNGNWSQVTTIPTCFEVDGDLRIVTNNNGRVSVIADEGLYSVEVQGDCEVLSGPDALKGSGTRTYIPFAEKQLEFDISTEDCWYRVSAQDLCNQSDTRTPLGTPYSLILCNSLGSNEEITNSTVGPNLEFYDPIKHGRNETSGAHKFIDGPYTSAGKAFQLTGNYRITDRVHRVVLPALQSHIDWNQGAIESWFLQINEPVPFSNNYYRIFDGGFGLSEGAIGLYVRAPNTLVFELGRDIDDGRRVSLETTLDPSVVTGSWIHIAAVWDRTGINGSSEALRLYVNGKVVASSEDRGWYKFLGDFADIGGANDDGDSFAIDELKLWNFAKTDFSTSLPPKITHQGFTKVNVSALGTDLESVTVKGSCPVVSGPKEFRANPKREPVRSLHLPEGTQTIPEFVFDIKTSRCWWLVTAVDRAGNIQSLDPVVAKIRIGRRHSNVRSHSRFRGRRRVIEKRYRGIPAFEQYVTVKNGASGIRTLRLFVNGQRYVLRGLKSNEVRRVAVGESMKPGARNRIIMKAIGIAGSRAQVIVADKYF